MAISFVCVCGKGLKAPDGAAGKQSKCPGCGALIMVPDSNPVSTTIKESSSGLDERIARLSHQFERAKTMNRVLTVAVIGCLILSGGTLIISKSGRPVREAASRQVDVIEAKRFVIRSADGKIAAEFGIMDEKPSVGLPAIRLFDRGKVRAELCVMSHDGVRFSLNDLDETGRASIFVQSSATPNGTDFSEFSVTDKSGNDVIHMNSDEKGNGYISLFGKNGRTRIQFEVFPEDKLPNIKPTIRFFDAKGGDQLVISPIE